MATAVLHPHDYLAAPQTDRDSHLSCIANYASPFARPLLAGYEAAIPLTEPGRHAVLHSKARENRSTGLLPPPDEKLPNAHNMGRRLVPGIPARGFPQIVGPYGIKQARWPCIPVFDHTTTSERILSDQSVQPYESRLLLRDARFPLNSAISCQRLKSSASPHFLDALNPARRLQRAGSFNPSAHDRNSMHPVEICSHRQRLCAKPPIKVLPEGHQKSHLDSNIVGAKPNVCKQLKRSASAKVQERSETPSFRRSALKHDKKLITSLSEGVVGKSGSHRHDLKPTCSATPAPSLGRKIERSPEKSVPLGEDSRRSMFAVNADAARLPQQMVGMTRTVGASSHGRRGSVSDNDELWVSMMNDERWAGPSSFNSPSPSALPLPSFPLLISRAPSTGSESTSVAGYGADNIVSDKSSSQASCTWDVAAHVALATKDLRRMLRLDNASLNI